MKKKIRRRNMTLIEILIVMFLIGLIAGVLAYNYAGALEEGKAFKTKETISKLQTFLTLQLSNHPEMESQVESKWKELLQESPLMHNPEALLHDGWGEEFQLKLENDGDGRQEIKIQSRRYEEYKRANPQTLFR